mgnify:CR=1 FL=1
MVKSKDYMTDLCNYIKKNLKKGYTLDSLKWALVNQGYSKMEVEKALRMVEIEMAQRAPILNAKPEIKYEVVDELEVESKSFFRRLFGL